MSSAAKVDFSVRPNKCIERKLIVAELRALALPLQSYRYVGFGGFQFVDFKLLHRELGIPEMVSIERLNFARRARFNRPLKCVTIAEGDSTDVLESLDLAAVPSVVWLDYDSHLCREVLDDASLLASRLPLNSVIVITLNVSKRLLKSALIGECLAPGLSEGEALEESLRSFAEPFVPTPLDLGRLSSKKLGHLILEIVESALVHYAKKAGLKRRFVKRFWYEYADGSRMATLGGLVAAEGEAAGEWAKLSSPPSEPLEIAVPVLTPRERSLMDRLIPSEQVDEIRRLGKRIGLHLEDVDEYRRFYLEYPNFAELIS